MKLVIDARLYGISHTGIGRYTENLIAHLPDESITSVTLIVSPVDYASPQLAKYHKVLSRFHPYHPLAQLEMLLILARLHPDLYHATDFTAPLLWFGPTVITIHDLIKLYHRGPAMTTKHPFWYWFKYIWYRFNIRMDLHKAVHVIVPSHYWADLIQKKYHLPPDKISVIYEGVDSLFFQIRDRSDFVPDIPRPYLVHVGNLYPHKNISVVISALDRLAGSCHLALIGSRDVFSDRVPPRPFIRNLGRLTDAQLKACLHHSLAYVYPSLMEGFGLQGLEAMAAGTVVLAASGGVLPEIYGSAALYFNPNEPSEIIHLIKKLIQNPQLRTKLIHKGYKQARKYSWSKMASETWQIYLRLSP